MPKNKPNIVFIECDSMDGPEQLDIKPWSPENEERIAAWLEEYP